MISIEYIKKELSRYLPGLEREMLEYPDFQSPKDIYHAAVALRKSVDQEFPEPGLEEKLAKIKDEGTLPYEIWMFGDWWLKENQK
jgi:hypothetical protein